MFKVYMTQGQGEVLVGEFEAREDAQSAVTDGIRRGDGSYRYTAEGTAQEDKKDDETVPF